MIMNQCFTIFEGCLVLSKCSSFEFNLANVIIVEWDKGRNSNYFQIELRFLAIYLGIKIE